jgi:glycosyltransferase involved in cell wall biosynthesis
MIILHVAAPGEIGGLERVVQLLARGARERDHEVHVAAVVSDRGAASPFFLPLSGAGIATHSLVVRGRAYLRERAGIADLCRAVRPDVVHTHGYRPDVLDAPVARRLGIPVVTTMHGFLGGGWKDQTFEWLQCRAARHFDAVVAVSRPIADRLADAGVPRDHLHLVPNAWREGAPLLSRADARRKLGLPPEGFRIGWIGRLSHEKGPDVLLDALPALGDLVPAVSVLGNGTGRSFLEARARSLGIDSIRWHGAIAEASRFLRAFDVIVLSSRTEGSPMILLEAMAAEVPIVTTRVGGIPDMISEKESLMVPPNDPVSLAEALRAVHEFPGTAYARARVAHARLVRDCSFDGWIARYESIYAALGEPAAVGSALP